MKRIILLVFVLSVFAPIRVLADGYTGLWKRYNAASKKDLPQTELSVLQTIISKAEKERAYGHLLKAQLARVSVLSTISPDSLQPEVAKLEQAEQTASDKVLKAVYCSVLGRLYALGSNLEDAKAKSAAYYKRSMSNPDLLAQQTTRAFTPLIETGTDSRIFYDDLLHVIGFEAQDYKTLRDYYSHHNNRPATCICDLKVLQQCKQNNYSSMACKSSYLQSVDSLIKIYEDLPECGELAIERYQTMAEKPDVTEENKIDYINWALGRWGSWPHMNVLRNAQKDLTTPMYNVNIGEHVSLPHKPRKVYINSLRNITELTMNVYRLTKDVQEGIDLTKEATVKRLMEGSQQLPEATRSLKYYGQPDYKVISDSTTIIGLPMGTYMVVFSTDNRNMHPQYGLLRVSNLAAVWQELPNKQVRIAVLNATTGEPVPFAKLSLRKNRHDDSVSKTQTATVNAQGEYILRYTSSNDKPNEVRIYTDEDKSLPYTSFSSYYRYYDRQNADEQVYLYTDRKVYRPGQTVHVALISSLTQHHTQVSAQVGKSYKLTLRDANYKVVSEQQVTTDAYGTAWTDFVLPEAGLTGTFSIRTNDGMVFFRVEEYKRPTFQVEFDPYKNSYEEGDTVTLTGHARSYAGVPVQGAKVAYNVMRHRAWWWRSSSDDQALLMNDTIKTAADGSFKVRVPIILPERLDDKVPSFFNFKVQANVTDAAGESHEGTASLPLGTRPTAFSCNWPDRQLKDSLKSVTFSYRNNAGQDIPGEVNWRIDSRNYKAKANEPVDVKGIVSGLESGAHELMAVCGTDTLRKTFVVFTLKDKECLVKTHDWFYQSASEFPADGKPVYIQLGSSDNHLHVLFTALSGSKMLQSESIDLDGELLTQEFTYKPEYGDCVVFNYAWVKDGKAYTHKVELNKPLPDKRLLMKWTTFRDRLVPGQRERWTLHIERPDGKPAKAQLLATLFDKSLDDIVKQRWDFKLNMNRSLLSSRWHSSRYNTLGFYDYQSFTALPLQDLNFSHLDNSIWPLANYAFAPRMATRNTVALMSKAAPASNARESSDGLNVQQIMIRGTKNTEPQSEEQEEQNVSSQLRENLNETAFFYPNLESDEKGNLNISFTLPESITTWRFIGLAHDGEMNNGLIEGETVAKKTVMVQPNVPRFVRSGDKVTISSRIFNTSDKPVKGVAKMELIDAATMRTVYTETANYVIDKEGSTNVTFSYEPKEADAMLICRVTASGKGYSDGEQHYLPILPDYEQVTNTVPFTQLEAGTKTIDVANLFASGTTGRKLTVEYTNNPTWLMVQALPYIGNVNDKNAISLASAYYANTLGSYILHQSPAIKQTLQMWQQERGKETSLMSSLQKNQELKSMVLEETPWLAEAESESDQKHMLINFFDENALNQRLSQSMSDLQKLQLADGSFSWWPGMRGNTYMTVEVVETLVRLNKMTGDSHATDLLNNAFTYLDKQLAKYVAELKKEEKKGAKNLVPSETACHYLYCNALAGRKQTSDITYLINLLAKKPTEYTIYGKANSAIILSLYGQNQKAQEYLQSLREYTVYKEEMGRYFDTPKALYSWFDYRIPSQVAAIEALKLITPDDNKTISEMQRWLLQQKRTTSWDTPINSVNAVYAFLNGETAKLTPDNNRPAAIKVDGHELETSRQTAGLGYVKGSVQDGNPRTVTVKKTSDGTSWGAVYAQFLQKSVDVKGAASGLSVKREVLNGSSLLHVGDRVKVRITITADRNYDFVQVQDKRAACMEPVSQLSGYHWGYYCTPRDNTTNYYFDRLSKGKHVIETEYYIDRVGDYQTGTCTVQCAYSPEFMGREAAQTLKVNK